MKVVVTGIGLLSAFGSLEPSWQQLLRGKSAIGLHQPFPDLPHRPLALMGQFPVYFEQLIQQVVTQAIQDANLSLPLLDCGIVVGSSRSCQAIWEQWSKREGEGEASDSPFSPSNLEHWLEALPHRAAIATARQVGSTGPVLAPMAACATGIWAIAQGMELIQMGQCQRVIAGAIEAPITPLTVVGFEKMGALAKTGAYPFDTQRDGLVLGEGGALFVLESADLALSRGASIYGTLLGFGLTSDAYHVSAPAPNRQSATRAVKQCLERSHLSPEAIDYIHAHGTGTQLNDQNEAHLIQRVFGLTVPVSSTKGATGHTLGASGAIGTAFCLKALKHQLLPPCVGLRKSEFELNFVRMPRQSRIEQTLCFSFGFGGQNAVLALARAST